MPVIPAKAGIQKSRSEQKTGVLHFGKQTRWYRLYGSDFRSHQEDMGAQKQHGGRFHQTLRFSSTDWHEVHENMEPAIEREKRLKEWKQKWKLEKGVKDLS